MINRTFTDGSGRVYTVEDGPGPSDLSDVENIAWWANLGAAYQALAMASERDDCPLEEGRIVQFKELDRSEPWLLFDESIPLSTLEDHVMMAGGHADDLRVDVAARGIGVWLMRPIFGYEIVKPRTLADLQWRLNNVPVGWDQDQGLPKFGGPDVEAQEWDEPVWSWDHNFVLVGLSVSGARLERRGSI